MPAGGHPAAPAAPALAALGRARHPPRPGPDPARPVGPAGVRAACCSGARRRSSRPAATSRSRSLLAATVLRIPSVLWEGNVVPGRSVRFVARLRDRDRGEPPGDRRPPSADPHTYVTGTPIRSLAGVDVDEARERFGGRPRGADPARVRRVAGRAPDQRRGAGGAAAARRAGARRPRHRRRRRTRPRSPRARRCPRRCATATGPSRSSRRRDDRRARGRGPGRRAGPAPRRSPRRPRSRSRRRSSRTRTRRATSGSTPSRSPRPAPRSWSRTRTSTRDRLVEVAGLLADPSRHAAMSAAARELARPERRGRGRGPRARGRATASRCPTPAEIEATARGGSRPVTGVTPVRRRSRSAPTSSAASASRPSATSRSRATRRCASAARPTCSPSPTTRSSCAALVRFARARAIPFLVLGRGSNLVVADAGFAGLVIQARAEGSRIDGDRYHADAGVPMARAATETQQAGLTGLEFGLAIPGTVGGAVWANAGAHGAEIATSSSPRRSCSPTGRRSSLPAAELRLHVPPQPAQGRRTAAGRRSRRDRDGRDVPARGPPTRPRSRRRLDDIRRWRRRAPAAGHPVGRVGVPQPGGGLGRPADRRRWASRATVSAARSCPRSTPTSSSTTRRARPSDVRRRRRARPGARSAPRHGVELAFEVEFAGDWAGWTAEEAA